MSGRILYVEDEEAVRSAVSNALREAGWSVEVAEHGEDGLEALKRAPGAFDLILSDVSMPVMSGPEMVRAASAEELGRAKLLFLSGYAVPTDSEFKGREVAFMPQPVQLPTLMGRVRQMLAS